MVKVYGYAKCSTVKKALKFLSDNNIEFTHIDNVANPLSQTELLDIYTKSGLDKRRLFNTSGIKYRELGLKDQIGDMNVEAAMALLSTDGMLVKRPILVFKNHVLIGFKLNEWEELLLTK